MTETDELLSQIRDTSVPDKDRILRTRFLVRALCSAIADRALAERLAKRFDSDYLDLQLATISGNGAMMARCRKSCVSTVDVILAPDAGRTKAVSSPAM